MTKQKEQEKWSYGISNEQAQRLPEKQKHTSPICEPTYIVLDKNKKPRVIYEEKQIRKEEEIVALDIGLGSEDWGGNCEIVGKENIDEIFKRTGSKNLSDLVGKYIGVYMNYAEGTIHGVYLPC